MNAPDSREPQIADPIDHDDLDDLIADDDDAVIVDGLFRVLAACAALRAERVARGWSVEDVIDRCPCDPRAIEWVDEGDVGAPLEGLVYYAAALDVAFDIMVVKAQA